MPFIYHTGNRLLHQSDFFLQEGICVSRAFSEGSRSERAEPCVPWQPCHRQGPQAPGTEAQRFCSVQTAETGCFCPCTEKKSTAATINVTTWRAATKQKCHPPVKFWRHLVWGSNSASKTHTHKEKDDAAVFLQQDYIFFFDILIFKIPILSFPVVSVINPFRYCRGNFETQILNNNNSNNNKYEGQKTITPIFGFEKF